MSHRPPRPKNCLPRPFPQDSDDRERDDSPLPRLTLENKHPSATCWLTVRYRPDADVSGRDFIIHLARNLAPYRWVLDRVPPMPDLDGVRERVFVRPGTALFNGWTEREARAAVGGVRVVAQMYGLPLYRRSLTVEDLL